MAVRIPDIYDQGEINFYTPVTDYYDGDLQTIQRIYGVGTTTNTIRFIQKRYFTKTDDEGRTQTVEVNVEADGTVKVEIGALELLLGQVGFKAAGGTV